MVVLQLDPHKPDEQPTDSSPRSFSMMERFWSFFLAASLIGAMLSYYEGSVVAFTGTLTAFMSIYCALCLAKIVEEVCK